MLLLCGFPIVWQRFSSLPGCDVAHLPVFVHRLVFRFLVLYRGMVEGMVEVTVVAGLALLGGFLATVVPFLQFLRLFRTRMVAGVSKVSWLLNLSSSVLWASYGFSIDRFEQVAVNAVYSVVVLGVLWFLLPIRWWVLFAFLVPAGFLLLSGVSNEVLGPIVFVFSLSSNWPQAILSIRRAARGFDFSAVSLLAYSVGFGSQICWLLWGLLIKDWTTIFATLNGLLVLSVIVVSEHRIQRRLSISSI